MADQIREWLTARHPSPDSESPIEALLAAALEFMASPMPRVPGSTRKQQAVIGWYRVDFLFGVPGPDGKEKRLVVEVDGHDFHERTKEQAAKDKARDRYMVDEGIEVRRYTGSEVWANPFGVAEEIIKRCHVLHTGMSEKRALSRAHMAEIARLLGMDSAA